MTKSTSQSKREAATPTEQGILEANASTEAEDNYVKLAMRNMVRKGRQSLWHFFLTVVGLLGVLVGLAYLTKP